MEKTNENSISLNKYISATGLCSRREADQWINAGRVSINGQKARTGNRVFEGDVVLLDGKPLKAKPKALYLAFNKPVGIVCTTDPREPKNIIRYLNHPQRLFPIGRLDKPSQGLIFLTNDGDIVNKILRAGNQHEKEYRVKVKPAITPDFIDRMSNGLPILGTVTQKCSVEAIDAFHFTIVLTQGLNRQIRRMCEYLGYEVLTLKRTRIMDVRLGRLGIGQWRILSEKEIKTIQQKLLHSSKTEEASIDRNRKKRNNKKNQSTKSKSKRS
ncbi:MAG: 23S rRNA pseudouridine(2604) synthase RluF [Bacteroidota bacterium]